MNDYKVAKRCLAILDGAKAQAMLKDENRSIDYDGYRKAVEWAKRQGLIQRVLPATETVEYVSQYKKKATKRAESVEVVLGQVEQMGSDWFKAKDLPCVIDGEVSATSAGNIIKSAMRRGLNLECEGSQRAFTSSRYRRIEG